MHRYEFQNLLKNKILVLDGGYGTEFFKMGYGTFPGEMLNIQHPEVVLHLQKSYVESGADILLTNTFNANPLKLKKMGIYHHFDKINEEAITIARKASKKRTLVFGDISSSGEFIFPLGNHTFDEVLESYFVQAKKLFDLGVDGFIIETMSDMKELKAAVIAIREVTPDLPIIAQMTFEKNHRAVTGTSVEIFGSLFNDLDVDVVGMNCSTGLKEMLSNFKILASVCDKNLSIEPNAGNPEIIDGNLYYHTSPEDFAVYLEDFINAGVNIIGGCCGTTKEHIKIIKKFTKNIIPKNKRKVSTQILSSRTSFIKTNSFFTIGERINPASKPIFQSKINKYDFSKISLEAIKQKKENASVIDINLGVEKLLTEEHFKDVITTLDKLSSVPLSLDIQTNSFLEISLREYCGRPLINSAKVIESSLEKKAQLLHKYGGMIVLLAMDKKIPKNPKERLSLIKKGIDFFEKAGISRNRIIADALVLSLAAKEDPNVTLETIRLFAEEGIKSVIGLSNISFGLPNRSFVNGAFLAQAINNGLTSAIINTADTFVINSMMGALTLRGKIEEKQTSLLSKNKFTNIILNGEKDKLEKEISTLMEEYSPLHISQEILSKAMEEIGHLYAKSKIYLPQLLLASETAQPVFDYLNSLSDEKMKTKGKVLLATVEGDIHDIGKKIIGTVLKSNGYEVIDIGTDLTAEEIVLKSLEEKPDIIGLSAMMTTTIGKIKEVVDLLVAKKLKSLVIAGGASMNEKIAEMFGCDGYAEKASEVVNLCDSLLQKFK